MARYKLPKKQKARQLYKNAPRCAETEKKKYPSESEANRAITIMWGKVNISMAELKDLHSWRCEHCGSWHIGHASYFTQRKGADVINNVLENARLLEPTQY